MNSPYHAGSRSLQDRFDTRRLADRIDEKFLSRAIIDADDRAFIERMDMFFLATADAAGRPQCSYKGGDPGFVRVLDESTLAFPSYDGNGMYLSAGNVLENPHVGMLFIDFVSARPSRLRLNGIASVDQHDELIGEFPEAQLVIRVRATQVFPNCPPIRPPHGSRRAFAIRPAPRCADTDAGLEALRVGTRRASKRRSCRDMTPDVGGDPRDLADRGRALPDLATS